MRFSEQNKHRINEWQPGMNKVKTEKQLTKGLLTGRNDATCYCYHTTLYAL